MLRLLKICFLLFPLSYISQGLNIVHENVLLPNGGGIGYSIHCVGDTIFVFGGLVDEDIKGVGICILYDTAGNFLNSYEIDSQDSTLNVVLGQQGGVDYDALNQQFIIPIMEWKNETDQLIRINSIGLMDLNGDIELIPHPDDEELNFNFLSIRKNNFGGYNACGWVLEDSLITSDPSGAHGFLMELDENGNTLWMQRYDEAREIKYFDQNANGEFILGGGDLFAEPFPISSEHLLIKTDALGNELWRHSFGGEGNQGSLPVAFQNENQVIAAGHTQIPDEDLFNIWIKRLNDNGSTFSFENSLQFINRPFDEGRPFAMHIDEEENVFIAGDHVYFDPQNPPSRRHGFFMKLNSEMDSLWFRRYLFFDGVGAYGRIHDICELENANGFALTGVAAPLNEDPPHPFPGLEHVWLLTVDEFGCLEPGCEIVGAEEIVMGLQDALNVYPNPVQEVLNIEWKLNPSSPLANGSASGSGFQLHIVNQLGQIVHTAHPERSRRVSDYQINLSTLPAGHYTLHWMSDKTWIDSVKFIKE